jgi:hypothetical protein
MVFSQSVSFYLVRFLMRQHYPNSTNIIQLNLPSKFFACWLLVALTTPLCDVFVIVYDYYQIISELICVIVYYYCYQITSVCVTDTWGVRVNDDIGPFFSTHKGLCQGDPLSPILFNIVADMLALLFARAKEEHQFNGIVPHLIEGGLSILQYADDTVVFLDHNIEQARNVKLLLTVFEQMSGLKINFHKSELFCYGMAKDCEPQYSQLFGCSVGTMPFKYLGIPMTHRRLRNSEWRCVVDRFESRLSNWKAKFLSSMGRLVLINFVLSSLPIFMISFFEIPAGVLQKLDAIRSRFFWQGGHHKKKYRLAKWEIICQPKELGGLGVANLDIKNICLLSKWLFKLLNEDGVWQRLLRNKYLRYKSLTQAVRKSGDSHFWAGLMNVKDKFLKWGYFKVGNEQATRFWKDK